MSKLFSHAGVSKLDGEFKVRYTNDALRTKVLIKNGHTDIELIDLPREMTKAEIAQHMIDTGFGKGNSAIEAAIKDLQKKNPAGKQATKGANTTQTVTAE